MTTVEMLRACGDNISNDAANEIDRLNRENDALADKLTDCWLFLDQLARSECLLAPREQAKALLKRQLAPGWKGDESEKKGKVAS